MKNRNKNRENSKNPVQGVDNQLQQPDLQNQGRNKSPEMNQGRSGNLTSQGNITGSTGTPGQQRRSGLDEGGNSL
jgi:hypothetical protein